MYSGFLMIVPSLISMFSNTTTVKLEFYFSMYFWKNVLQDLSNAIPVEFEFIIDSFSLNSDNFIFIYFYLYSPSDLAFEIILIYKFKIKLFLLNILFELKIFYII